MLLTVGSSYRVCNLITREETSFLCQDVFQYQGLLLVYGTSSSHSFRLIRGITNVPSRPSCFVVAKDDLGSTIGQFSLMLGGLLLGIFEDGSPNGIAIINYDPKLVTGLRLTGNSRDDYLARSQKVAKAFLRWKTDGKSPEWLPINKRKISHGPSEDGNLSIEA